MMIKIWMDQREVQKQVRKQRMDKASNKARVKMKVKTALMNKIWKIKRMTRKTMIMASGICQVNQKCNKN